jgi:2-oxo-4-hydroxy-4-carboxy-5-ureidoimidazoline decarboxylase
VSRASGLDRWGVPELTRVLMACLAAPPWVEALVASRPHGNAAGWLAAADAAYTALSDDDVLAALAAHPRIGASPSGAGAEAAASRREQAQVTAADDDVRRELAAGNVAYEERFGRVFLIRAAGRPPEEILAELRRRLGNDDAAELAEAREQLRQITMLRLERVLEGER